MLYVIKKRQNLKVEDCTVLIIYYRLCAQIFSITLKGMLMKARETAKNLGVAEIHFKANEGLV